MQTKERALFVLCDPVLRERVGEPVPELAGLPSGSPVVEVVMRRAEAEALERAQLRGINAEVVRLMARLKRGAEALERARLREPLQVWVEKCWAQRRVEREARKVEQRKRQKRAELAVQFARGMHG